MSRCGPIYARQRRAHRSSEYLTCILFYVYKLLFCTFVRSYLFPMYKLVIHVYKHLFQLYKHLFHIFIFNIVIRLY